MLLWPWCTSSYSSSRAVAVAVQLASRPRVWRDAHNLSSSAKPKSRRRSFFAISCYSMRRRVVTRIASGRVRNIWKRSALCSRRMHWGIWLMIPKKRNQLKRKRNRLKKKSKPLSQTGKGTRPPSNRRGCRGARACKSSRSASPKKCSQGRG